MQIGLFFDMRNPAWCRRPWAEHYRRAIEVAEQAEALGIDAIWLSEHHLFDDGYLPQPLTLAAAIASCTERVRIGTAVLLAALRHPLHIAEEAAIVDLVSAGRLELGFGAGYRRAEFAAAGAEAMYASRFEAVDTIATEVRRLLAGEVTPPPVQQPVPVWYGFSSEAGARRAGRAGVGLLSLDRTMLAPYREALGEAGHDPMSARMGGVVDLIVSDDPERDAARIRPHAVHQTETYHRYRYEGRAEVPDTPPPATIVVTAQEAVTRLRRRTDGLPVEHVYCWASVAGMPDDIVDTHVRLLATHVKPELLKVANG